MNIEDIDKAIELRKQFLELTEFINSFDGSISRIIIGDNISLTCDVSNQELIEMVKNDAIKLAMSIEEQIKAI